MSAQSVEAANRTLRAHVDVSPQWMRGADLQHAEIERTELLSDGGKAGPLSRICAVVEPMARTKKGKRRPQRLKAIEEASTREMSRRQRGNLNGAAIGAFHPIQFEALR